MDGKTNLAAVLAPETTLASLLRLRGAGRRNDLLEPSNIETAVHAERADNECGRAQKAKSRGL
jgi:hypothetical protein